MNLWSQLVAEAESFRRDQKFSTVQNAKISKVTVEQLNLGNRVDDVVDKPKKNYLLLLQCDADKPKFSMPRSQFLRKGKKKNIFNQFSS